MGAVYRKELRTYATSMIGYVFIAFILVVIGIYFAYLNLNLSSPKFEQVLKNVEFLFIVFVPILTMRVLAEERKQKTDQLLLTLPLSVTDIVVGKFLALVTLYAIPMVIVCFYPFILSRYGTMNMAVCYLAILSFFLLGCANMAIGVFFSSLTENPVIAAVMSFGTILILYLMNTISTMIPNTAIASLCAFVVVIVILMAVIYNMIRSWKVTLLTGGVLIVLLGAAFLIRRTMFEGLFQKVLSAVYMNGRLTNFFDGILDVSGLIYYVSIMVVALFLAIQTVTKRRWN